MTTPTERTPAPEREAALRTARLVAAALIGGCFFYAALVVGLVGDGAEPEAPEGTAGAGLLGWISWGYAASAFLLSFLLVRFGFAGPSEAEKASADRAPGALRSAIVALAVAESAVLVPLTLALVSRSLAPHLYAAAIGFAGLLLHFPTRARFGLEETR